MECLTRLLFAAILRGCSVLGSLGGKFCTLLDNLALCTTRNLLRLYFTHRRESTVGQPRLEQSGHLHCDDVFGRWAPGAVGLKVLQ